MSKANRDFKGVWIPKNIWINTELSWIEKLFLVEIDSLDNDSHCYASNSYFADFFQLSKARCTQVIKSLEGKGYLTIFLERKGKQVIKRILVINRDKYSKQGSKNTKQPIKNIKQGSKNTKGNIIIQDNNTDNIVEQPLKTDYIDFNELIKQGKNIGVLGQAKALLQEQLNYLTFDDFDNKIIQRMLNSIHSNIKANNAKKGIFTKTTQQDIINAFKKAITALQDKGLDITSLSYLNSCLNQNLYLQPEEDYTQYIEVIKTQFKHYNKLNAFDISKLKAIINTIKKQGSKDTLEDFKTLFNNLPDYILKNKSYQSVSYIASKIDDLLQVNDIEYLIENHESYAMLKESYGEKRAKELIRPIFSKSKSK